MVYRVRDEWTGADRALKLLHPRPGRRRETRARLRREWTLLESLHDPGIVGVHAFGHHHGHPYLVMDLIVGQSLQDRLLQSPPLSTTEGLDVLRGVLSALDPLHRRRIIHRDIKPANILVVPSGTGRCARVVLVDFELARRIGEPGLTRRGRVRGTLSYMAPEQRLGAPVSPATDLYSCGVVILDLFAERFERMPAWLGALAGWFLEEDPVFRPKDAAEASRYLGGEMPPTLPSRKEPWGPDETLSFHKGFPYPRSGVLRVG